MPGWGVAVRVRVWDWETELAEREKTGQGAAKPEGSGEGLVQAAYAGAIMPTTPSTALRNSVKPQLGYKEYFDSIGLYLKTYYLRNVKVNYGLGTGGKGATLEGLGGGGNGVGVAITMVT